MLCQVEQHAAAGPCDRRDPAAQLVAAVAAQASEEVAGKTFRMQPHQNGPGWIGRADQDREMFKAAVARAKRDQPRIFGIGERHAGLGDAFKPGGRRVALEDRGGIDDGKISAARE